MDEKSQSRPPSGPDDDASPEPFIWLQYAEDEGASDDGGVRLVRDHEGKGDPAVFLTGAYAIAPALAALLRRYRKTFGNWPSHRELADEADALLRIADDNATPETNPPSYTLPVVALRDMLGAVRGASEAGYFDDEVKAHLDAFAEAARILGPGDALTLHATAERIKSTGGVQDAIRKAANLG